MLKISQKPIETGHKRFDKIVNEESSLMTGNVMSNCQFSWFIRPFNQTEFNGSTSQPGELQKYDLKQFDRYRIPSSFVSKIQSDKDMFYILYCLRTKARSVGNTVIHGWILTDKNYKLIHRSYGVGSPKSDAIVDGVLPYLTV